MSFEMESLSRLGEFRPEEVKCIGEHKTIEVNGVSILYEEAGEGKPVILVHGNGDCHQTFYVQIKQLAASGYKVYALDSRGQGANAPLPEYHYADMAEDVYQFIEQLGLEKPAFFGWSDGGIVFLYLELAHPGTLGPSVICGANYNGEGIDPAFAAFIKDTIAKSDKPNPLMELMLNEPDLKPEQLETIETPVLVLAGTDDVIPEQHTKELAAHLKNSTLLLLDGEDHGSYIQGSKIAGDLLLEFLKINRY